MLVFVTEKKQQQRNSTDAEAMKMLSQGEAVTGGTEDREGTRGRRECVKYFREVDGSSGSLWVFFT